MHQEFHSCIAFNINHQATKLDPFGSQAVYMHPKGRNMRQLHSFTAFEASEKAKIDAPLQPQGRVVTPPRGVHIHFR